MSEPEQRREKVRQAFDAWLTRQDQQRGDLSDEELEAEVKAMVEEVRAARWEREQVNAS